MLARSLSVKLPSSYMRTSQVQYRHQAGGAGRGEGGSCCVRTCGCQYLESVHQLLPGGDVGDVDGGAESVQHLHLLQHVLPAGGPDDEQLAALREVNMTMI